MGNSSTTPRRACACPPPYKKLTGKAAKRTREWRVRNTATNVVYDIHAAVYNDLAAKVSEYEHNSESWFLYYTCGAGATKVFVGDQATFDAIPDSVHELFLVEHSWHSQRRTVQQMEWSVVLAAGDNVRNQLRSSCVGNQTCRESHALFVELLDRYYEKYLAEAHNKTAA